MYIEKGLNPFPTSRHWLPIAFLAGVIDDARVIGGALVGEGGIRQFGEVIGRSPAE